MNEQRLEEYTNTEKTRILGEPPQIEEKAGKKNNMNLFYFAIYDI